MHDRSHEQPAAGSPSLYVTLILDESGSMQSCKGAAIAGFNGLGNGAMLAGVALATGLGPGPATARELPDARVRIVDYRADAVLPLDRVANEIVSRVGQGRLIASATRRAG